MNPLQDAFISYGRIDSKDFAKSLNLRLTELGYTVWFDFENIPLGVDYQKQINDGIEKADNVLFLISPHSVNSEHCALEIELALKRKKRIIPLLHVQEIDRNTWQQRHLNGTAEQWAAYTSAGKHSCFPNMHPEISKINWVYFREGLDDYEESFQGLLNLLALEKAYVHQHTVLLNNALEWVDNQKQTQYLLTGEKRQTAEDWLAIRFKDIQPPVVPTDLHCAFITESIKNANNLMTQVFLSHAEEDREITEKIRSTLMRSGITTWSYRADIVYGSDFEAAIAHGVEETDNVLFLMSPQSLRSQYCQHEIDLARQLNKRLIIMLVAPVEESQVPVPLRNLQYIDLTNNKTEADYQKAEDNLLRMLKQEAAYYNEHKILLTKAVKWERQQRNPCILLQGYELQHALAWRELAQTKNEHGLTELQKAFLETSKHQTAAVLPDVFISYSRADADFARKLNASLQRQRKRTWFDQESIASGVDFRQEIFKGIETSNFFLFVLSPRAIRSQYCADEVEHAAKLNKRVVTVLHQPVETIDLHPELAKVQWIDFSAKGEFDANFKELLRVLDTDPVHLKYHTQLLIKALEWDTKSRREDVLLRGDDLTEAEQWMSQAVEKEPSPTALQGEYLAASRALVETTRQAAVKRQWILTGALGSLLIMAVAGGIYGFTQARQAKQQALNAEIRADALSIENLMASELNFEALLNALELGQKIQNLETHTVLNNPANASGDGSKNQSSLSKIDPGIKLQVKTILREIYNFPGYLHRNTFQGHSDAVFSVGFAPDGQTLVSASKDGTVRLWDREGKELQSLKGHSSGVTSVSFAPDGQTFASGSADGTVKLWDWKGQEIQTLKGHSSEVTSVSFAPNGQTLASASKDGTVRLWDREGRELQILKGHSDQVWSVSFAPDGQTLASASKDGTVRLWDREGRELQILKGHSDHVLDVSFSPDGQTLASASADNTIKLWNQEGQELQTLKGHSSAVFSVSFSPDGQTLASAGWVGTVKLWDLEGRQLQTLKSHSFGVRSVSFSPDGQTLASTTEVGTIKLWDREGRELQTFKGHSDQVFNVGFSPDGRTLASASKDSTVKLWDREGRDLQTFKGHSDQVWSVSFAPDGQTLASTGKDGTIKLWNQAGKELQTLIGHSDQVLSVSFSPNGQVLASASRDGTVKLWNREGEELQTLIGHSDLVHGTSFSPNGQTLASSSTDGTVKLWNLDGQELQTLKGHSDKVWSVRFAPDGQTLASASRDGTVRLWDREGRELQIFKGHAGGVTNLSFSPDGQTLASSGTDGTVKLWNLEGQELQTFKGHFSGRVHSVSFSPDGQTLASAGSDDTVILWNLDLDDLITKSCDWLRNYMTTPSTPEEHKTLCANKLNLSGDSTL